MKKIINLFTLAALLLCSGVTMAQCPDGELQCSVTIIGADSYGDGWNGAKISVYQGDTLRGEVTVPNDGGYSHGGIEHVFEIAVCSGDTLSFVWTSGSYDSECSYTILNGDGTTIHSGSGAMATQYAEPVCPTCIKVTDLTVSGISSDGATISWTGNETGSQWLVYINGEEIDDNPISDTFYIFSGLDANTGYSYSVRTYCGDDTSSAVNGTFRTLCENGSCEVTFAGVSSNYGYAEVWQSGALMASVTSNGNVEICSGDSLIILYHVGSYTWSSSTITITDADNSQLAYFDGTNHSTGDTIVAVANGCPNCLAPGNLHMAEADTNFFTMSWDPVGNAAGYLVYLNGTLVTTSAITDTFYTFTVDDDNLVPMQRYTVQVRTYCGDDDTSAYRQSGGATSCSMIHIDENTPYNFSFVNCVGTTQADYPCWYFSHSCVRPDNADGQGGDAGIWFLSPMSSGCSGVTGAYMCMPVMDAAINTLELSFTGKVGTGTDYPDKVIIGVADISGENVVWIDTVNGLGRGGGPLPGQFFQYGPYTFEDYDGEGVRFAFKLINYGNWNILREFNVRAIPQCLAPTQLAGHNYINADSTYFTWTPQGGATQWQVVLTDTSATSDDVDGMAPTNVTDTSFVIPENTLTPGEEYIFWVRSNCGAMQSEWVSHTFYCGTVIMPESGTDTVSGCNLVIYDNGYQAGYITSSTSTIVVRPETAGQLVGIAGGWYGSEGPATQSSSSLIIYDGEGTDGTILWEAHSSDGNHLVISDTLLGEEGAITIRLSAGNWVGQGCEIFTFCTAAPTCLRPKHLSVSNVDSTSATITWTTANATDYIIYYRTDTSQTWESINVTGISDSTYTFADGTLDPATNYTVKIAGDCGNGDISLQSSEVNFRTACSGDNCQVSVDFTGYYSTNYELIQNGYSFGITDNDATYNVCAGMPLYVRTTPISYGSGSFIITNTADIELLHVDVDSLTNDTLNLGNPCPSCLPAIGLHVDSTSANSGTLTWSAMGSNTDWVVYVDGVMVSDNVSDTTYTFTGLDANTVYTLGVRALCDQGDTSVIRTTTMRTDCANGNCEFTIVMNDSWSGGDGWNGAAINVYQGSSLYESATIDNGYSAATATMRPCLGDTIVLIWHAGSYDNECSYVIKDANDSTLLSVATTDPKNEGDTLVIFDGLCNAQVMIGTDTTTPGPQPEVCNAPNGLTTTVTEYNVTVNFNAVSDDVEGYEVEIVLGEWNGTLGNSILIGGTSHTFNNLQPGTQYTVAVRTVCDLFEEEYSEWTTVSATTATVIVDECETPTGLTVVESTLTTTSATLSWTENGDATEWEIKLTTAGVDSVCTANSNPYTVNGLRANSSYQVRVRAICSETEQSEWSAMTSFQTPQGVGIDGVDMLGVNLYPNPASSVITLEVAEKAEVTLIDQSGRECSKWSMVDGKLTIDVSTLATGTYYFRVVCTSGIAVRKLVVK